ncbi:MAG: hypothetical protein M1839_003158 [Geoglossum umbratile]|nr:MAG: hypothetical protein M1839_003158 [Geoglossum umbratile]
MIPKPACVVPASPLIIQAFLHRAAVELEVVALTACVIDRLSNKFALKWRRECPLVRRDPVSIEYPFTSAHGDCHGSEGDPFPRPEIVALASLMLAAKFLDDRSTPTSFWAQRISGGRFSCNQLNTTERLILHELDFEIQPFCSPECISRALRALKAAGKHRPGTREVERSHHQRSPESASSGEARVTFNLQPPALTGGDNSVAHDANADGGTRGEAGAEVAISDKGVVPSSNSNLRRAVTLSIQRANQNLFLRHVSH